MTFIHDVLCVLDVQEAARFTAEGIQEWFFSVDKWPCKRDAAGGTRHIEEAEDGLTLEKASLKRHLAVAF